MIEVIAFAHAFADAGEDGIAAVFRRDVADKLLDEHRLTHSCPAEEADLTAFKKRDDEIDRLDARFEDLGLRRLFIKGWRRAMNGKALHTLRHRPFPVDRLAKHVKKTPQRCLAHRNRNRCAGRRDRLAARESGGLVHGNRAHAVETQV